MTDEFDVFHSMSSSMRSVLKVSLGSKQSGGVGLWMSPRSPLHDMIWRGPRLYCQH